MMSQYSLPGVYTENKYPLRRPQFRTGVPIFFGLVPFVVDAEADPSSPEIIQARHQFYKTPIEVSSEFGFTNALPQITDDTFLKSAVFGFFRNGGKVCYVMPLPDISYDAVIASLQVLEDLEEGDLLCFPDLMWAYQEQHLLVPEVVIIQSEMLAHCAKMATRFAILDGLPSATLVEEQRQALIQMQGRYGALYYPWIKPVDATRRFIAPSGHIAGTYSRMDDVRGIHKAPANEVIHDVLDVSDTLSQTQRVQYYDRRINTITPIRGRGIRAWGAYSLSTTEEWKYLTTSRLFCKMSRWVKRFMQEMTFENNDIYLWTYIEGTITLFLYEMVQQGEIKNYFVRCNAETNPPAQRENGIVRTEIGLAPSFPMEFIIIRVMHGESGVSFSYDNYTTI